MSFSHHLFLLSQSSHPFMLSFKFVASLFYKLLLHIFVCMYMHIYAFLTCSVCIMLHQLYMFSGLIIWYWINTWFAAPWGTLFFCPQHYLVAYSCMCRKELAVFLLSRVACLFLSLFCSCFDSHVGKTSCVELLTLLAD